MSIAQVCPRYHPYIGGIETHVQEISQRLSKKGLDIEVLTTDPSKKLSQEEEINGIKIRRFQSWTPNEAYYFSSSLKDFLQQNSKKYKIVHAHSYHAFPALYAMQSKTSNSLVFTPHYLGDGQTLFRNILHFPYKLMGSKIFERADSVICVSEYEKEQVTKRFGVKDTVKVIPNGVDFEELSKFKWNPDTSNPKITFSGRLEKSQKNVDKLIRSFPLLLREFSVDARFVILGRGPFENEMLRLVRKLGLGERLTWKRWLPREQYLEELASSSVFIAPSERECFGIAAAEAIVLGVPTVVADSTALAEFVQKGLATGISLPLTPEKIARAISEALDSPITQASNNPKGKILSWDDVVTKLIDTVYMNYL